MAEPRRLPGAILLPPVPKTQADLLKWAAAINIQLARIYAALAAIPLTTETYTVANLTLDRTYDAAATTVGELANVLGTLLKDLKERKGIG